MRPEPSHRTTKRRWPNEQRPLTIRIGSIRDELDARSDGSESGYRSVIMRDLKRYYALLPIYQPHSLDLETARLMYTYWTEDAPDHDLPHKTPFSREIRPPEEIDRTFGMYHPTNQAAVADALERAHILVTHAGLTVDAALVAVGLVKEEE